MSLSCAGPSPYCPDPNAQLRSGIAGLANAPQSPVSSRASRNPVFLILAGWIASGIALNIWPAWAGPLTFAFVALGWVLAVGVHEFCHAWVAYRAGDYTIIEKGYLSFDPRRYADLQTTLVFPLIALALGGIGFPGGAVYLRDDLMRTPLWRSAASLAGPVGTLIVLIVLTLALGLTVGLQMSFELANALAFLALLQATALVLNLIPVPGFDGYGAIRPFLPPTFSASLRRFEPLAPLVFLAAFFFIPQVSSTFFGASFAVTDALGLAREPMIEGLRTFQFWKPQ